MLKYQFSVSGQHKAAEGMLNSSNDNPSVQDVNDLKAKLGVPTPKAAHNPAAPAWATSANAPDPATQGSDAEVEDYNYVVPIKPLDKEELKQLEWSVKTDNSKLPLIIGIFVAAFVVGAAIGFVAANVASSNADIKRKASVARTIQQTAKTRISGFEKFVQDFKTVANSDYNSTLFNEKVRGYSKHNFMLDISSDVSAEVILLAGDPRANPIADIRSYSANTLLLTQLLSVHVNETNADAEEIQLQLDNNIDENITYAMQINADAIYYLETEAPRTQYANGVIDIYTVKSALTDDVEATEVYSQMKTDNTWSEFQRQRRDYIPTKQDNLSDDLDLPNRLLYEVIDKRGNDASIFADELILVDRKLLFGSTANALERYNRRTEQIRKLIDETIPVSQSIEDALDVFISSK